MENNKDEKPLRRGILGFILGLAVIIPGVSGSTIAIIFKLYDKIIESIANIFKKFKKSILFLLPIVIGMILGFLLGFFSIQKLVEIIPFTLCCIFAGLMLSGFGTLTNEVKDTKISKRHWLLLIVGIFIPITITLISIFLIGNDTKTKEDLTYFSIFNFILFFIMGFIVAITQFIPGCSATVALMVFGYYKAILKSVDFIFIKSNPIVLLYYFIFIIGALIGVLLTSKLINYFINKYKNVIYFLFIGLSISSIICLFINVDMLQVYNLWLIGEKKFYLDLPFGIIFGIICFIFMNVILKYSLKKSEDNSFEINKSSDNIISDNNLGQENNNELKEEEKNE